jgi:hypothetical protein
MAKMIEYVVLAEFDIDKGSTCRHQVQRQMGREGGREKERGECVSCAV